MAKDKIGTIELFDGYSIQIDRYNFAIAKMGHFKSGDKAEVFGYFRNLRAALVGFRNILVRERLRDGVRTLENALEVVKAADEEVERFIAENIPGI